jgi:hypothetical protein
MVEGAGLGHPTKFQLALVNSICGSVGVWLCWGWGYVGDQFGFAVPLVIATILIVLDVSPSFAHRYVGLVFLCALTLACATGIANSPFATAAGR